MASCALLPAFAAADEAEILYDPTTVSAIDLQLPPESIANLTAEPEEYQPGTFSFAQSNGSPDGIGAFTAPQPVEVRLKGSGSFKPLSGRAAFKLKFPKAGPFLGLRKMTLNNMVEDPSMTHETLAYTLHRALGIPASRTGFAYLTLNGQHYGLYLNVENYDDIAMAKKFGSFDGDVQHVYEGESGTDVEPGEVPDFEIDEGPEDDVSDLEGLAAAVTNPGAGPWWAVSAPAPTSTR